MNIFRPRSPRESEFAFETPAPTTTDIPLKRTLGAKNSSPELRLYKRSRNGSSDEVRLQRPISLIITITPNRSSEDVSVQRPKSLTIITTSNEKLRAIKNSSVRELILSPINTSTTQIDGQISDTLFVEPIPDSPTSTAGSMEHWERSSTLSRFSMGSAQTGVTVPHPGPALSLVSSKTPREQISEEELSVPTVQPSQSLHREPASESQEGDARSLAVPTYNRFLTPKKSRSVSEITFDNPKEYRAERLKRSFSSTSSLSKFSPAVRLPTVVSSIEPEITKDEERSASPKNASEILDIVTQIEELEDPFIVGPVPILPAEPRRADSGFSSGDGLKSAHGLLKEIAAVGEDVKRVTQGNRKTAIIKDVKITAIKSVEEEVKGAEEKDAKKNKLFGRLKDRMKGLKKKVSGAMKGGKEI